MKSILEKYKYNFIFFAVSFILYGNTLKNEYGLDDEFVTGPKNITAKGFRAIPRVFKTFHVNDESGNNYEYRPLVKVTFAIEHGLWGENIALSHLVNILLYYVCLVVLLKLLTYIFNDIPRFTLFFAVIIFAFFPIHSEVVASLKNRDIMLSFIFSMSGFIQVMKFSEKRKWYYLLLALLLLGMAFLSKFDVVPMILVIPLTLYQKSGLDVRKIIILIVLFLFAYLIYKLTKRFFLDRSIARVSRVYQYFESPLYFKFDVIDRISAGMNSMGFYIKMLIFPDKMACYYGYNVIPVYSFTSVFALLGLTGGGWMAFVFFKRFNKPDLLWYGVFLFLVFISMYLNFATPAAGIVADRFMFFASIGFSLILLFYLLSINKKIKNYKSWKDFNNVQKAIPLSVFFICSVLVFNRNKEWHDKLTLFESDVKKQPESVKLSLLTSAQVIIHMNDGGSRIPENQKVNKIRYSEKLLAQAIKTDSSCGGCYNNIAFLFLSYERNPEAALPYLRLGFLRDSTKKEIACNIGIALFRLGRVQEALPFLFKSIELDKKHDFSVPYEVLQDVYSKTNPNEGVKFFASEIKKGRMPELMYVLMGKTYFEARDTANSIKYYKEALNLNPENKPVSDFVSKLEIKYLKKNW